MLQTRDATKRNYELLLRAWEVEAAGPRKSYLRAWHVAFGRYFWMTGLLKLINDSCMLLNPILINTIVDYIDPNPNPTLILTLTANHNPNPVPNPNPNPNLNPN